MSKPGPARRPALAVVREGNPGHRAQDDLEPGIVLPAEAPEEPHWPSLLPTSGAVRKRKPRNETDEERLIRERHNARVDEERDEHQAAVAMAHETWEWAVRVLDPAGILTAADQLLLTDLCLTWLRICQAEADVSRVGLKEWGAHARVRNSALTTAGQYRQHWKWLCGQLGLSPVARDAMRSAPAEEGEDTGFDV